MSPPNANACPCAEIDMRLLRRLTYRQKHPLAFHGAQHTVTIGATRTGKTRTMAIPATLDTPGNLFLVDLDGITTQGVVERRESLGQFVWVIDPFRMHTHPARGTPDPMYLFPHVPESSWFELAHEIATALVPPGGVSMRATGERMLITCAILLGAREHYPLVHLPSLLRNRLLDELLFDVEEHAIEAVLRAGPAAGEDAMKRTAWLASDWARRAWGFADEWATHALRSDPASILVCVPPPASSRAAAFLRCVTATVLAMLERTSPAPAAPKTLVLLEHALQCVTPTVARQLSALDPTRDALWLGFEHPLDVATATGAHFDELAERVRVHVLGGSDFDPESEFLLAAQLGFRRASALPAGKEVVIDPSTGNIYRQRNTRLTTYASMYELADLLGTSEQDPARAPGQVWFEAD